eukprot:NODE_5495_length_671_cov_28.893891_g5119_i0.p1 GENE.NODE_5495_length_671_cov_28.893891_g5119_i0~~NODE_5495_length_671_cov_28.893891_g5119_i0.p1  ORF type:complete len:116 (+),score=21.29 NODE_5495_length_671_cov_28.893891_g5119_i0:35-382(+)
MGDCPKGLQAAALDHRIDLATSGAMGHTGSDGSNPKTRMERHGKWGVKIAENVALGRKKPQDVVEALVVDDGVDDRGHRKNIFNPVYKFVGISAGPHSTMEHVTVMDFAGGWDDK